MFVCVESDFTAVSQVLVFSSTATSASVEVTTLTDSLFDENSEKFEVVLTSSEPAELVMLMPDNAVITIGKAIPSITIGRAIPSITIGKAIPST